MLAAPELSWSQVGQQALANAPASITQGVSGIVGAVTHPLATLSNLGNLAGGFASQAGIGDQSPAAKQKAGALAVALENHYKQTYLSGTKAFKQGLATDPFGAAMDASMLADPAAGSSARSERSASSEPSETPPRWRARRCPTSTRSSPHWPWRARPGLSRVRCGRGFGSLTSRVPLSALNMATEAAQDPLTQAAFTKFAQGAGSDAEFRTKPPTTPSSPRSMPTARRPT